MDFAKQLLRVLVDPTAVVEIFMGLNSIQETTAFLLEALKGNKPEEGYLQTKLPRDQPAGRLAASRRRDSPERHVHALRPAVRREVVRELWT